MRAVGLSDLDMAARALLAAPPDAREALAMQMIEQAHLADMWRKRYGTAHISGGTGSLYAQASLHDPVASSACTAQYCLALATVLAGLQAWRRRGDHET